MSTTIGEINLSAPTPAPILPTPRALLTSLLSSTPPPLPPVSPSTAHPPNPNPNPLTHAPHSIRTLLTTLHILLPTLLLPALDLLDRALLTRITIAPPHTPVSLPQLPEPVHSSASSDIAAIASSSKPLGAADALSGMRTGEEKNVNVHEEERSPPVYLVRSSQALRARSQSAAERVYIVRLGAWNCNCAAFTFSAFPGPASSLVFGDGSDGQQEGDLDMDGEAGVEEEARRKVRGWWGFGGMSNDGLQGGGVPCCKHILACVLTERFPEWVAAGVKEREVGREEMAGLGCEV